MKIALCTLCFNSAQYIPEAVGNFMHYVDEVNVLVDNRTKDNSRELLKEFRKYCIVRIKEYTWVHDFSAAKNECIKMVSDDIDWIIYLDDDEKMTKEKAKEFTERIRKLEKNNGIGGILLPRKHHYPDWTYDEDNYLKEYYPDYHMIAFKNLKEGLCCNFRVHEDFFKNSVENGAKLEIIKFDDINRHHHAWKGNREKWERIKSLYFGALQHLPDEWRPGDPIPKGAEDINIWDTYDGSQ